MVPLHAQRCPDAPDCLRWVTPPLHVVGSRTPLADLVADGTLAEVLVEPSSVVTRLGAGHTWATVGPRVRTALHQALASCTGPACRTCTWSQCFRRTASPT